MRVLLIDDLRVISEATHVARTYDQGLTALKQGNWDKLLLDHDLGEPEPKNGYQLLCWIEEQHFLGNHNLVPKKIILVTDNPVGRQKMQMILQKITI